MLNEYDFAERLAFSRGKAENTHPDTIRALVTGCVSVEKASESLDRQGIDFVATLRRGTKLNIDMKIRAEGCSQYWKAMPLFGIDLPEPELALETWSVCPSNGSPGKAGWTLNESKLTDFTLHVFDPRDSIEVFLLPFQLLRIAFRHNYHAWLKRFPIKRQSSITWESECVFVPGWHVMNAIAAEMRQSRNGDS